MSIRIALVLALVALVSPGCGGNEPTVAPNGLRATDLSGRSFNIVAKNASESVILLGQLRFSAVANDHFTGSWTLRQWSGSDVPGLPGSGALDGSLFGGTALVRVGLP